MASVFVSYAREDAAKAKAIACALEDESFNVWIDQRIGSGSEFSREIEEALKSAAAVVVLWSTNSVESPWVRDEAAEGRDSGRLVPVLLDGCRPPIGFRQFQAADLSRWSGRGRPERFKDVIAAVRARSGAPPKTQTRHPAPVTRAHKAVAWAGAALALLLVAVATLWLVNRNRNQATPTLSVALLPFAADSSDADARELASAAHESVAHTLSQGAFSVRTIDSVAQGNPPADFVISGQMARLADKFVATVRMEETAHHVVVFSHQFETSRDKAGDFPELIGAQVAAQLSWTVPLITVERRHPSDPAIVAALLQSSVAGLDNVGTLHDYETARRLAAQAPQSPLAQSSFAFSTAFGLDQIPRAERAQAVAEARRAADRTIELAPEYGGALVPWCLLHSEQRKVQCEDNLRAGMRANPDDAFYDWFLSRLLNNVGRNGEALELAGLSLAHDQYMPYKIAQMLRMLELAGHTKEAADLYRQSSRWWPGDQTIKWYRLSGMALRGDLETARRFDIESGGSDKPNPVLVALDRDSLSGVRTACSTAQDFDGFICMVALARLGDMDGAFALAERVYPSRRGRTPADEERIWLDNPGPMPLMFLTAPVAASLRRDARYIAIAGRVGLLEYWRSGRPPDFCRPPHAEPICARLLARG